MKHIVLIDSAMFVYKNLDVRSKSPSRFQLCTRSSVLEINSAYFERGELPRANLIGNTDSNNKYNKSA